MIGAYTGPVLILHGDKDAIVPLRYSERAAQIFPNAELVVKTGKSQRTITPVLASLKGKGLITRIGSNKTG